MTSGNSFTRQRKKTCAECGKEFRSFDCRVKYCSSECRKRGNRQLGKRTEAVILKCPVCASEFVSKDWRQVYCSAACRQERNKQTKYQKTQADWKSQPIALYEPRPKPKLTIDDAVRSGRPYREIQLDELRERGLFR